MFSGWFSRIGAGATPFLLPMMLQLGFGMSPAQSGLITFTSSAGSLAMRMVAPRILRKIGFRNVMVWVGLVATVLLGACAGMRPAWPLVAIYALLLSQGFFQSLMFMAYNTIAYADIPRPQMSAATSFYTTIQQVALSTGIAVAAAALSASLIWTGHAQPGVEDFSVAFLVITAFALLAPLLSAQMDPDAGAELSEPAASAGGAVDHAEGNLAAEDGKDRGRVGDRVVRAWGCSSRPCLAPAGLCLCRWRPNEDLTQRSPRKHGVAQSSS